MMVLLFFLGCRASTASDPEVEAILADLEEEYPLEEVAAPLTKGAVGGVNVWEYCLSIGYTAVGYQRGYIEGPDAATDNWVCQRGTEQLAPEDFRVIDMDAACSWQYGRPLVGRPSNEDHAWSYDCYAVE